MSLLKQNIVVGIIANLNSAAIKEAYYEMLHLYNAVDAMNFPPDYCDVIVTLGGDGAMLRALHYVMHHGIPVFGMNMGSIGFLLNKYSTKNLIHRIHRSCRAELHPLKMIATNIHGEIKTALAVNEVSMLRQTNQSAKIAITINGKRRMQELVADGVLLCTPAGSTAYNFAAHGPLIPLDTKILALTPISPFRPRRWPGALLVNTSHVKFDVLDPINRPVSVVADSAEFRNIATVEVVESKISMFILFDPESSIEEKILNEQFFM